MKQILFRTVTTACLFVCCTVFIGGCCTMSVRDKNRSYANARNEVSREFHYKKKKEYAGYYTGIEKHRNADFMHYQFRNVLAGDADRILDIFVPADGSDPDIMPKVAESRILKPGLAEAVLYSRLSHFTHQNGKAHVLYMGGYGTDSLNIGYFAKTEPSYDRNLICCVRTDIRWTERNKNPSLWKNRLRYLYSVPADIVTLPVQIPLILLIISDTHT